MKDGQQLFQLLLTCSSFTALAADLLPVSKQALIVADEMN
jgi:hypothetical protein